VHDVDKQYKLIIAVHDVDKQYKLIIAVHDVDKQYKSKICSFKIDICLYNNTTQLSVRVFVSIEHHATQWRGIHINLPSENFYV